MFKSILMEEKAATALKEVRRSHYRHGKRSEKSWDCLTCTGGTQVEWVERRGRAVASAQTRNRTMNRFIY